MADFEYGKAISDSFKLVFNNVHLLLPLLSVTIINLLFSPIFFKLYEPSGELNLEFLINNIGFLILLIATWIISIVLSYLAYGWTLALIGNLMKKGKADLLTEFKNAPRKGWRLFLISLILFLASFGFIIVLMLLMFIGIFITPSAAVLGILLTILFAIALFIGLIFLILAFLYVVPLLALEDFGAIQTMKLSYEHFKNNKGHSLALFLISVLIILIPVILVYLVLFAIIGTISKEDLFIYMFENPLKYSLITFFTSLPSIVFTVWSFCFITIAYVKKKKISKTRLA